jgi:DNA-binding CsgD family transcriptional regulator
VRSTSSGLLERVRRDLDALENSPLDLETLVSEAAVAIGRAVPYDAACWHTIDPTTLIETTSFLENIGPNNRDASEIEYLRDDYNKFAVLAQSARHSGILSEATDGDPRRSLRYWAILDPNGLEGELRMSFVVDGACWGSFGLLREPSRDFDADEAAFLHEVAPCLGRAFRSALVRGATGSDEAIAGPGLILFDARGGVEAVTPAARAWLKRLGWEGEPQEDELPYVVYTVSDRARRAGAAGEGTATARALARSGEWVVLHAATATGAAHEGVAVILDASKPSSLAPLIAHAYGLSKREREVTELVLEGAATAEIAERLMISPHTVQEHLKWIFEKVGVRSRRELIGQVFVRHYRPKIEDTTAL